LKCAVDYYFRKLVLRGNRTDLGKCTHQRDKTQTNNSTLVLWGTISGTACAKHLSTSALFVLKPTGTKFLLQDVKMHVSRCASEALVSNKQASTFCTVNVIPIIANHKAHFLNSKIKSTGHFNRKPLRFSFQSIISSTLSDETCYCVKAHSFKNSNVIRMPYDNKPL